jgi:tetratricopeptide (TPR) repeat protein
LTPIDLLPADQHEAAADFMKLRVHNACGRRRAIDVRGPASRPPACHAAFIFRREELDMAELDDALYERIGALSEAGDALVEDGDYAGALEKYWQAFDLLPEPRTNWEAGTWLMAAVGDTNFHQGDYEAGRDNLGHAMHFPDAIGNPFLHLRLGQCQFELGNLDRAADELMRAYMGGGPELFEDEDDKYLRFLGTRAEGIKAP